MNKKISGKMGWFYVAIGCVIVSLLSMFLPILRYTDGYIAKSFNIVDIVGRNPDFEYYILTSYQGPVVLNITVGMASILAIIAVIGFVCAIVGLVTLRVQRPNTKQLIFTIAGLVSVSIPSIVIIVIVLMYGHYYDGYLSLGIAPIISPIALLVSIGAVIRRKNKEIEELRKEAQEKGLIWEAGDL